MFSPIIACDAGPVWRKKLEESKPYYGTIIRHEPRPHFRVAESVSNSSFILIFCIVFLSYLCAEILKRYWK